MKLNFSTLLIAFTLFCSRNVVSGDEDDTFDEENEEEKWFETYLNHFDVMDNRMMSLRYYEFSDFYEPGGPLLIEIGSQMAVRPKKIVLYPSYDLAKKVNGKLILLEHRFYGESLPYGELSVQDLTYLSVEQALEDLALFIETFKKDNPLLKVAVFGCSYSGALATWVRYKFPHLVDAAWASSAPLHVTLEYPGYYEITGQMYANVSQMCVTAIEQGYKETVKLLSTPEGFKLNRAIFGKWKCGKVEYMTVDEILITMRAVLAQQYNSPGHFISNCKFLQSKKKGTSYFEQLARLIVDNSEEICTNNEEYDTEFAERYQGCTEFGYGLATNTEDQPFKDSFSAADDLMKFCTQFFGDRITRDALERSIKRKNRLYGSTNLKVTRVVSIQGTHDPWHRLGLCRQKSKSTPVFLVEDTSHCAEYRMTEDSIEFPSLIRAKEEGMEILAKWLK